MKKNINVHNAIAHPKLLEKPNERDQYASFVKNVEDIFQLKPYGLTLKSF